MDIIALVLSSLVSIVAILATAYQTRVQERSKIIDFYITSQLDAYKNLLVAIANLERDLKSGEKRDLRELIAVGEQAKLLSTHRNAKVIENFCAVYIEYIEAEDSNSMTEELLQEFKDEKFILTTLLRDEICRYDKTKRKSDKLFKKKRSRKK